MFTLKGIFIAKMSILIQAIWLKGSHLTYVTKKLTILVMFTKIEMQIN
jgi:hypothetical protein